MSQLELLQCWRASLDEPIEDIRVGNSTMSDGYLLQVKRDEENPTQKSRTHFLESTQSKRSPKREDPFRCLDLFVLLDGQQGGANRQMVEVWEQVDEEEQGGRIGADST